MNLKILFHHQASSKLIHFRRVQPSYVCTFARMFLRAVIAENIPLGISGEGGRGRGWSVGIYGCFTGTQPKMVVLKLRFDGDDQNTHRHTRHTSFPLVGTYIRST
jgi:hypothetical protein